MAVFAFTWKKTRSTTTDVGPELADQAGQLGVQDQQPRPPARRRDPSRGRRPPWPGATRPLPGSRGRNRSATAQGRSPIRTCVRRLVAPAPPGRGCGPGPRRAAAAQPSKAASTSSEMSALECTAWTSSWSSIASSSRSTFLASPSSGTGTSVRRLEAQIHRLGRDPGVVQRLADRLQVCRCRRHDPRRAVARHVLGATLHGDLHDLVLVVARGHGHDPLALELPRDRARLGHVAAVAGEEVAHLGAGAIAVVRSASRP